MQSHIRILESTQENVSALLLGLEYLIFISYVDDTEVFKVGLLFNLPYFCLYVFYYEYSLLLAVYFLVHLLDLDLSLLLPGSVLVNLCLLLICATPLLNIRDTCCLWLVNNRSVLIIGTFWYWSCLRQIVIWRIQQ